MPTLKHSPHNFAQRGVLSQQNQDSAQVIAEWSFVEIRSCFQIADCRPVSHHFMQPASNQIRMPANQSEVPRNLRGVLKR